jgi:hypothetical protein
MSSARLVRPGGQISGDFGELGESGTTPDNGLRSTDYGPVRVAG